MLLFLESVIMVGQSNNVQEMMEEFAMITIEDEELGGITKKSMMRA